MKKPLKKKAHEMPVSMRWPADLLAQVDEVRERLRTEHLELTRGDAVRMLVSHGLDVFWAKYPRGPEKA